MGEDKELKVVLFTSRNKDNKDLSSFEKRSMVFLTSKDAYDLQGLFRNFVEEGVVGELSRFYQSVNTRDNNKVRKALMHYLLDHEDFDMSKLDSKVASLAARSENRKQSKWLFDFDEELHLLNDFVKEVRGNLPSSVHVVPHQTPNGYAVVVDRGFDTRELLEKWPNVELKRDDMLCVNWLKKEG